MDLLQLAERCEAASGPDRELDEAIHIGLGNPRWHRGACRPFGTNYTASIDSARSLIEEPQSFSLSHAGNCIAKVQIIGGDPCEPEPEYEGYGETPPLALAAAALRARAASLGEG